MSSLVTENVGQAPSEYTSMGISLTCSEALCWQESLGYPRYKSLAVIPFFLSLSSFYHLRICGPASLLGYPVMNSSRSPWIWPSPKTAAWSQKSRSLNWTHLCATCRYSVQVWTGTGLDPVTERCSEVKMPLLHCKCTLCATFCLPDLSCARSASVGDTQTQLPGEWQARRRTFTDGQLPPATSLWTEALLQSCTHLQSTLVSTTTSCRPFREDIWGKKHLAFNQAGDWALQTFHTAELANSSSSGV